MRCSFLVPTRRGVVTETGVALVSQRCPHGHRPWFASSFSYYCHPEPQSRDYTHSHHTGSRTVAITRYAQYKIYVMIQYCSLTFSLIRLYCSQPHFTTSSKGSIVLTLKSIFKFAKGPLNLAHIHPPSVFQLPTTSLTPAASSAQVAHSAQHRNSLREQSTMD